MTEATDDTTVEFGAMNVDYYDGEAGGLLRQIALGLSPAILIEPTLDDSGAISFNVALSLIDQDETVGLLRIIADTLEEGQEAAE